VATQTRYAKHVCVIKGTNSRIVGNTQLILGPHNTSQLAPSPVKSAYRRLASEAFFEPSKRKTVLEDVWRLTSMTEQAQIDDPRTSAVGISCSNREPLYAKV
jgi:hypothetical protein